jgi:hypothetical protein
MSVVVFCGPTLRAEERAPYADFLFLPPVRQGELYAAARKNPKAIGVIDGYFDGVPAVWHKEILWAIANGIAVFGASSMGALRAAELHVFGMRGVGRIFEAYRDGKLTDDDEVALVHGPAETGYLGLSVPMVNVRATLERAKWDGVIDTAAAGAIVRVAKAQFYQERSWASVLTNAQTHVEDAALKRFSAWLPGGKIDQKRDDALLLLDSMRDFISGGGRTGPAAFSFEWTETWANAPWRNAPHASGPTGEDEAILDELRLQGEAYSRVRRDALLHSLADSEISRTGLEPDRSEIGRAAMAFRSPRGLMRQSDVLGWAAQNDIDAGQFDRLMAERAGLDKLARTRDDDLRSLILDRLREEDAYPALRERARAKAQMRDAGKMRAVAGLPTAVLVSWYFGTVLGAAITDDLDAYARAIGLSGLDRLYELLAAEYTFTAESAKAKLSGKQRE